MNSDDVVSQAETDERILAFDIPDMFRADRERRTRGFHFVLLH
jgi:hypothetical protein